MSNEWRSSPQRSSFQKGFGRVSEIDLSCVMLEPGSLKRVAGQLQPARVPGANVQEAK